MAPEMRGGTANCTVCISDKPIASPLVTACDVLVAMNGPSLDKFEDMLVPGGHLFVNASVIHYKARRTDVHVHYVDCTHIAEHEVGNGKTANMVMLGAIIRASGVVSLEIMDKVLAKTMTGKEGKADSRQQDRSVCLERVRRKKYLETNYAYSGSLRKR